MKLDKKKKIVIVAAIGLLLGLGGLVYLETSLDKSHHKDFAVKTEKSDEKKSSKAENKPKKPNSA